MECSFPTAEGLVAGSLDTGLQYYVWDQPEPQGYCEMRLCVNVGSWCEEDEESGLSHFVEHMAFKSTRRFPEVRSIIKFLETKGAQYGHDLNACTGLFTTTYKFQLPAKAGCTFIEDGLTVLAEWAFGIQATEADVESERPVIREEWRSKCGARERLKAKYWREAVCPRIAARFPIGDLDVIGRVSASDVQRFYQKWYRPELMAVVVAGDLGGSQAAAVVELMRKYFGTRAVSRNAGPTPLPAPPMPTPTPGVASCLLEDSEVTDCSVALELLHPLPMSTSIGHLKSEVVRRVFLNILDRRFSTLLKGDGTRDSKCSTSVLDFAVSSFPLLPQLLCTSVTATVSRGADSLDATIPGALAALAREFKRLALHGVTDDEVARAAASWKLAFSQEGLRISAESLAEECLQHFQLNGQVLLSRPDIKASACREILGSLVNARVISEYAANFNPAAAGSSWRVCVQCGGGFKSDIDASWADILGQIEREPPLPWSNTRSNAMEAATSTFDAILPPQPTAHVVEARPLSTIGAVEYRLSNGTMVCCMRRPTPGRVALQAFLLGGSTELDEAGECAMGILDDVALAAGLGPTFDGAALSELQGTTQTRVNTQRHLYHRGLGGSTGTGNLELLLQLVGARMCLPRSHFEAPAPVAAVERARARLTDYILQREKAPEFALGQRARILSCGGDDIPLLGPPGPDEVAGLTVERCADLHARAFTSTPAAFTFAVVGDLPPDDELAPLLAKHLGRLPQGQDQWLPRGQLVPSSLRGGVIKGVVQERIPGGSGERSTALMIFHTPVPMEDAGVEHLDTVLAVQAACQCAEARLLESLRQKKGAVYNVSVALGRNSLSAHGHVTVSFHCEPARHDELAEAIMEEFAKLQAEGPTEAEASAVATSLTETHGRNLAGNSASSYWLFFLLDAYKSERWRQARVCTSSGPLKPLDHQAIEEYVLATSSGYPGRVASVVTREGLQRAFKAHFRLENYVHLVLEPSEQAAKPQASPEENEAKRTKL